MTSKKTPGVEYNVKTPIKRTPISRYFVKGWWENTEGKEITETMLGDSVRFHLKMKNIQSPEGKKVHLELREWDKFDFLLYILSFLNKELIGYNNAKEYETINIVSTDSENKEILTDWELNENSEIIIPLLLDENALAKMMVNDAGRDLELYFRCRYIDEGNMPEIVELPWENQNYLKVKPKPLAEPIIFVHASDKHLLPAIYSAADGSPWYIGIYDLYKKIKKDAKKTDKFLDLAQNVLYSDRYKNLGEVYNSNMREKLTSYEKNAYKVAIRNLEKGELIFNTGRKGTTSRFYNLDISEIDESFKDKIKVGVNRGTGIPGETSKGIHQLEAQTQRGKAAAIKTVGEIAGVFGILSNLAALLRGAADHNVPTPPIIPPFVTMEVDRMTEDIKDFNITHWNKLLQEAILKGKERLKQFLNETSGINKQYRLGYSLIDMSQEILIKILTKDIYEYNKTSINFETYIINESQGKKEASILVQSIEENDKYNRLTINHYIHALYVKDLKI